MNINKAYDLVMDAVKELQDAGIHVDVDPCDISPKDIEEMEIEKWSLDPSKWVEVSVTPNGAADILKVQDVESRLYKQGINFDSGSGFGHREWEIDWSFSCCEEGAE